MTRRRYLQLDVFAHRAGAGNPLGVVFDAHALDSASMQAYAAWANLSETIFFLPPSTDAADYRVRIFTPRQELPFAGHPSVGAAWAALDAGLVQPRDGRLVQECAAGLLPVRLEMRDGSTVTHVRSPRAHRVDTANTFAQALAAVITQLPLGRLAPVLWSNGPCWWLLQLANADAVRQMQPDLPAIAALTRASAAVGLAVFAPVDDEDHDLVVRAFCPADGIPEDPVTGSVNACIAAMLRDADALPGRDRRYLASQGRELGRDGKVEVAVDGDGEVWIGGHVQAVIRGSVDW